MNERERVPGYKTEEEITHRCAIQETERQRLHEELRTQLLAELDAKMELAVNSTAQKNCMVEDTSTKKGLFTKYETTEKYPAWYLGEWAYSWGDDYSSGETRYYFAYTGQGNILVNNVGVGERKDFKIGAGTGRYGRPVEGGLLSEMDKLQPIGVDMLKGIVNLPGWQKLIENQPEEGES